MEILLQNKAFVNVRNKTGMTPLHLAAKNGYTEMVQELIVKYNAQIDAVTLVNNKSIQINQINACFIFSRQNKRLFNWRPNKES